MSQVFCPRCQTRVRLQPNGTDCANCNTTITHPVAPEAAVDNYKQEPKPNKPYPPQLGVTALELARAAARDEAAKSAKPAKSEEK